MLTGALEIVDAVTIIYAAVYLELRNTNPIRPDTYGRPAFSVAGREMTKTAQNQNGHVKNLWAVLVWAVLVLGRFGIYPLVRQPGTHCQMNSEFTEFCDVDSFKQFFKTILFSFC